MKLRPWIVAISAAGYFGLLVFLGWMIGSVPTANNAFMFEVISSPGQFFLYLILLPGILLVAGPQILKESESVKLMLRSIAIGVIVAGAIYLAMNMLLPFGPMTQAQLF